MTYREITLEGAGRWGEPIIIVSFARVHAVDSETFASI